MPGRNWDVMDGDGKVCCKFTHICTIGYASPLSITLPSHTDPYIGHAS